MHIGIDVREANSPKKTGKGQWSAGFVKELMARDIQVSAYGAPKKHSFRWHISTARAVRTSYDMDVYISPTSFIVPFLLGQKFPYVPIIHDLIAFRTEPHDRKAVILERLLIKRAVIHARHICTVSEATKHDLLAMFPSLPTKCVTPIYAGPMHVVSPQSRPHTNSIVCIGTLCPRKNQLGLIQAYRSLPKGLRSTYRLILAGGRGWHDSEIVRLATESAGVQLLGHVSESTYHELIRNCTVFAFPSFYEGFGMSVLDALQHGAPVLTSNRGSLKEVAGDAAYVVNPDDIQSIANGLVQLLLHTEVRRRYGHLGPIQAKKFQWNKTVDLFLDALENSLY